MNFYFSGGFKTQALEEIFISSNACRLFSFIDKGSIEKYLAVAGERSVNIMLDSGAFSAWSIGKEIDINALLEYAQILEQDSRINLVMINLDKIPGEKGRSATVDEITAGMKFSIDNFTYLQDRLTFPVLPVFHQDEPYEYLGELFESAEYVCLSPRNDVTEKRRVDWARFCFSQFDGKKIHGLATTGLTMLQSADWYSVDSATWIHCAAFGEIIIARDNKFYRVSVSIERRETLQRANHILNVGGKDFLQDEITRKGFSFDLLATDQMQRLYWNMQAFIDVIPTIKVSKYKQRNLL